jgi:cleavage and polyadenylation specificity factor subunit 1
VPELVAATGSGHLGGFSLFQVCLARMNGDACSRQVPQRDLPTRLKRKLHIIGGGRGMWSFPVRQSVNVNGVAYDRPANPYRPEHDTIIVSTDANPSPGLSRVRIKFLTHSSHLTYGVIPDRRTFNKGRHHHYNSHLRDHYRCRTFLPGNCYPARHV